MIPKATIDEWPEDEPQAEPAPDDPQAQDEPPKIVSYYDRERKEYLIQNQRGVYLSLPETAFKRHLRAAGISAKPQEGAALSAADTHILDTQHHRDIAYSGPLCGRQMGFYEEGQTRFLVTESFTLPTPARGQ